MAGGLEQWLEVGRKSGDEVKGCLYRKGWLMPGLRIKLVGIKILQLHG